MGIPQGKRTPVLVTTVAAAALVIAGGCGVGGDEEVEDQSDAIANCVRKNADGTLTVIDDDFCNQEGDGYDGSTFVYFGGPRYFPAGHLIPMADASASGTRLVSSSDSAGITAARAETIAAGKTTTGKTASGKASGGKATSAGKAGIAGKSGGAKGGSAGGGKGGGS